MTTKMRSDESTNDAVKSSLSSVIDKMSEVALISLICLEFVPKFEKSHSSDEGTGISERIGELTHFLYDLTNTALSTAKKDESEYCKKIGETLIMRQQCEVLNSRVNERQNEHLRECNSLESILQLRCQRDVDCEQELKNSVEQQKIAEKNVQEFRKKAVATTVLSAAVSYGLTGAACALSGGILIPVVAGVAAVTNMVSTRSMLRRERVQLQKTLNECRSEKIETAERLISNKIDTLSTLYDQHLAHQNLKRSLLMHFLSEKITDLIVAEGQVTAKAEKLIGEIIDQLGHMNNIAFHLKEIFKTSHQSRQNCVIYASQHLKNLASCLRRFQTLSHESVGLLDTSLDSLRQIIRLDCLLKVLESSVSELNITTSSACTEEMLSNRLSY